MDSSQLAGVVREPRESQASRYLRRLGKSLEGESDSARVDIATEEAPAGRATSKGCRARADEWVDDELARASRHLDEAAERSGCLLPRVVGRPLLSRALRR